MDELPAAASVSTTVRASSTASAGMPVHDNGGDMLAPSQVNCSGIGSPSAKAELPSIMVPISPEPTGGLARIAPLVEVMSPG